MISRLTAPLLDRPRLLRRLAVVVPLFLIAVYIGWNAWEDYNNALEQEYLRLEVETEAAETQLIATVQNLDSLLQQVVHASTSAAGRRGLAELLESRARLTPEIQNIFTLDINGRLTAAADPGLRPWLEGTPPQQEEYFQVWAHHTQSSGYHLSRPMPLLTGNTIVPISRPLYDDRGRLNGVAVALIAPRAFARILKVAQHSQDSEALVMNQSGDIIYGLPESPWGDVPVFFSTEALQRHLSSPGPLTRYLQQRHPSGESRLLLLRDTHVGDLIVMRASAYTAIIHGWQRRVLVQLAGLVVLWLLLLSLSRLYQRQQERTTEADRFIHHLVDSANVMMVGLDGDCRVVLFNTAAEKLTGYTLAEIQGKNWFSLTAPERADYLTERYQTALRDGKLRRTRESPLRTKSGEQRLIAWQYSQFQGANTPAQGVAFGVDVTSRRRAEEALRRSESNLKRAQELALIGSWSLDVQTGAMEWSEQTYRIFALPPSRQPKLWHLLNAVHPEDRHEFRHRWDQALQEGKQGESTRFSHLYRIQVEGRVKWIRQTTDFAFDANGQSILGLGTVQDVTQQQEAVQRLDEAREFSDTVIASSSTGIAVFTAEGQCLMANPAASRILDMSPEELQRQNIWNSPVWQQAGFVQAALAALTTQATTRSEARVMGPGGREIWVEEVSTPVVINGMPHLLTLFTDIRKFREAEQAQRRAAQAAEAANRAKNEFLANISHEIRTPMNAIMGLTHLARREADPATVQSYLAQVEDSALGLLDILNDLLDYAKMEAGKMHLDLAPFDLVELLTACLNTYRHQAEGKGVALTMALPEGLHPRYLGDAKRLGQIVHNLLSNAVKFTAAGSIELRLEILASDDDKQRLRLSVRDSGIGISPAQQEQLFRPFEQLDGSITRHYGGTGLGLAICHQLLTMMQGNIRVESRPGEGSTFYVSLGLAVARDGDAPRVEAAIDVTSLASLFAGQRVLLASDNPALRASLGRLLAQAKLAVQITTGGDQALAQLASQRVALVLADPALPCRDGLSLGQALATSEAWRDIPRVALTMAGAPADSKWTETLCYDDGHNVDTAMLMTLLLRLLPSTLGLGNGNNSQ
ncbi:hypothetical protein DLREEDagrD3_08310 [Denitratisoma sp. agr-D3]